MTVGLLTIWLMASIQAQRPGAVRTVDAVNLDRYLGDWFEIARFPNRFQRSCAGDVTGQLCEAARRPHRRRQSMPYGGRQHHRGAGRCAGR